jgi:xylulokinase
MLAAMALGAIDARQAATLVPVAVTFRPDPRNRTVYDRLYTEFPGLYKAQRGMFRRLN